MSNHRNKLWHYAGLFFLLGGLLHMYLVYLVISKNLLEYPEKGGQLALILSALWLCCLVIVDIFLFCLKSRTVLPLLLRYWGIASGLCCIWLLWHESLLTQESGRSILSLLTICVVTPVSSSLPLGHALSTISAQLEPRLLCFLLCLLHFVVFLIAWSRSKEENTSFFE